MSLTQQNPNNAMPTPSVSRLEQIAAMHAKMFPNKQYRHIGEMQLDFDTARKHLDAFGGTAIE